MNELKIFEHPKFGKIRTITENGVTLFCGSDVAKALGYKKPSDAIATHCPYTVKRSIGVQTGVKADGSPAMQQMEMLFIPEGGVYRLAARSDLPGADEFDHWIFDIVLPSIRKHGAYMTPDTIQKLLSDPDTIIQLATALKEEQGKRKELEAANSALTVNNQIMQPKADYFDELVDRNLLTNFRETAKELGVKQTKFINALLDLEYVYRDKRGKLMPYAKKNDGLFEVKECFNEKTKWNGTQTLITPKGRETFRLLHLGVD